MIQDMGVAVADSIIPELVDRRNYAELEPIAESLIKKVGWNGFVLEVSPRGRYGFDGKERDALVHLLQLESVGGTDTDIVKEFGDLAGKSLTEVRLSALDHAIEVLRDQIENRHTYFIDVETMAATPFAILVEDVLAARRKELEQLEAGASRIDVLGTYYGFTILMAEGAKPFEMPTTSASGGLQGYYTYRRYRRKRTWLDEEINEEAAAAIRNITGEFASTVDMDRTYKTLGGSTVFKSRCSAPTAKILENAVRLSLYKAPTHRRQGARALGRLRDSRALPFLHNRMLAETHKATSVAIAEALGQIGHETSPPVIMQRLAPATRYSKFLVEMVHPLGNIPAPETKEVLLELMKHKISAVRAEAIACLGRLNPPDLVEIVGPSLKESSKPIVRQAVLALASHGEKAGEILSAEFSHILKVIGNDRPSQSAMEKLIALEEFAQSTDVHAHYAKKLKKETSYLNRWVLQKQTSTYHHYFSRYIRRGLIQLERTVRIVETRVKRPYSDELAKELGAARSVIRAAKQA
jgi:hypothetical protein